VVGYELPGAIASLLLAASKGKDLVYAGSLGTGFKHAEALALKQQLDAMRTSKPAVKIKGKHRVRRARTRRRDRVSGLDVRRNAAACER
jgi:bifunctional non-homologous end joining protein LigD